MKYFAITVSEIDNMCHDVTLDMVRDALTDAGMSVTDIMDEDAGYEVHPKDLAGEVDIKPRSGQC